MDPIHNPGLPKPDKGILSLSDRKLLIYICMVVMSVLSGVVVNLWAYYDKRDKENQKMIADLNDKFQVKLEDVQRKCDSSKNALRDKWDSEKSEFWSNAIQETKEMYRQSDVNDKDILRALERNKRKQLEFSKNLTRIENIAK